jgi:protein-S-isoprenylcysteine O-methyltransferase Ste14
MKFMGYIPQGFQKKGQWIEENKMGITNWVVLLAVTVTGITARMYRISAEEKMLKVRFGKQYKVYSDKTWKLVPFLY